MILWFRSGYMEDSIFDWQSKHASTTKQNNESDIKFYVHFNKYMDIIYLIYVWNINKNLMHNKWNVIKIDMRSVRPCPANNTLHFYIGHFYDRPQRHTLSHSNNMLCNNVYFYIKSLAWPPNKYCEYILFSIAREKSHKLVYSNTHTYTNISILFYILTQIQQRKIPGAHIY